MPEAALQPFVTSQRPTGVAGKVATSALEPIWTWQAYANAHIEAGPMANSITKTTSRPFGEQNKLGSYYCWNRIYEPITGRWTTPDPAATPCWNLFDYARVDPTRVADATGLESHGNWAKWINAGRFVWYTSYYKLTAQELTPPQYSGCGVLSTWRIHWKLSPSARATGAIVQRMYFKWRTAKCGASLPDWKEARYLEWWWVARGSDITSRQAGGGFNARYDDTWAFVDHSVAFIGGDTKGELFISGVAWFLETPLGGDLSRLSGSPHPWAVGISSRDGYRDMEDVAAQLEGSVLSDAQVYRWIRAAWKCCPDICEGDSGPNYDEFAYGNVSGHHFGAQVR